MSLIPSLNKLDNTDLGEYIFLCGINSISQWYKLIYSVFYLMGPYGKDIIAIPYGSPEHLFSMLSNPSYDL